MIYSNLSDGINVQGGGFPETRGARPPTMPLEGDGRPLEGFAETRLDQYLRELSARSQNRSYEKGEILLKAHEIVNGSRHGKPEDVLEFIAGLWEGYLGMPMNRRDVSNMMILLKIARATETDDIDNYVDIAGYAALAAEELK